MHLNCQLHENEHEILEYFNVTAQVNVDLTRKESSDGQKIKMEMHMVKVNGKVQR